MRRKQLNARDVFTLLGVALSCYLTLSVWFSLGLTTGRSEIVRCLAQANEEDEALPSALLFWDKLASMLPARWCASDRQAKAQLPAGQAMHLGATETLKKLCSEVLFVADGLRTELECLEQARVEALWRLRKEGFPRGVASCASSFPDTIAQVERLVMSRFFAELRALHKLDSVVWLHDHLWVCPCPGRELIVAALSQVLGQLGLPADAANHACVTCAV